MMSWDGLAAVLRRHKIWVVRAVWLCMTGAFIGMLVVGATGNPSNAALITFGSAGIAGSSCFACCCPGLVWWCWMLQCRLLWWTCGCCCGAGRGSPGGSAPKSAYSGNGNEDDDGGGWGYSSHDMGVFEPSGGEFGAYLVHSDPNALLGEEHGATGVALTRWMTGGAWSGELGGGSGGDVEALYGPAPDMGVFDSQPSSSGSTW
jgi:hypothetical protein